VTIQIDLSAPELAQLRQMTHLQDDAEAVQMATREYLRMRRLRELKSVSGKVDYDGNWQTQE